MNLDIMIQNLNGDLAREYSHWHFYMNASALVQGLHREEISEFLLKEASGEMKHVSEFQKLIIGLGGKPTVKVAPFNFSVTTPQEILHSALSMEDQVVEIYVNRIDETQQLQELGGMDKVHGKYIELFLEEQILDSRADADHIREMLKSIS
jgi:bacterioferritin (cytochrome b1)